MNIKKKLNIELKLTAYTTVFGLALALAKVHKIKKIITYAMPCNMSHFHHDELNSLGYAGGSGYSMYFTI